MCRLPKATILLLAVMLAGNVAVASQITGNPAADGWTSGGNALTKGVYVRGSANYAYDAYGAAITIDSGSNLAIDDGANSWLVGDTVLGAGGHFADITATQAGWTAFTGNAVNVLLGGSDLGEDVKLQAKFSTASGNFSPSTIAPDAGNGLGSLGSNGGNGAVQVRTSGWFYAADWSAKSGALQLLDEADHIIRNGTSTPDADVARLMWNWDPINKRVDTWEILLNVSLLDRLNPTFTAGTPAPGNSILMTVQNRDSGYTDALVSVPEPGTLALLGMALVSLFAWSNRSRRRQIPCASSDQLASRA
jgi:hypothetical protein